MRWGWVAGGVVVAAAVVVGLRIASNRGAASGVDLALANLPPDYKATHGAIAFNPVTGTAHMDDFVITHLGVPLLTAGSADVSGIGSLSGGAPTEIGHVTLRDVTAPPVMRHVDRIEADDIGVAALRTLFDPAAYPGGKPASTDRRPIVSSLQAFNMTLHFVPEKPATTGGADVTVAHEEIDGLSGRQFAEAPTPQRMQSSAFVSDVLRSAAYKDVIVEGALLTTPLHDGSVSMAKADLEGYDGGMIASETVTDIAFTGDKPKGEARLAKFGITQIDMTRLLDRLPAIEADPQHASQQLSDGLRMSDVLLRDARVDFANAPLMTMDKTDFHYNHVGNDVVDSTGTIRDLAVVTTGRNLKPQVVQELQSFGMQDFSLDADMAGSFDRATGHMVAKQNDWTLKGLGTLHLTGELDGMTATPGTGAEAAAAMMQQIRLIHADIKWDDASLTSRLFRLAEQRTGQSEDALRATLALPLASMVAFFPDQPDVADQVNAFLDGKHSLEVTLAPATPVSFAEISAAPPTEKAHLLGARIKGS